MVIKGIVLKKFRNYADENVQFKNGINLIVGQNAQGKTNIVEGVMICCMGKSPRTAKDKELISFGEEFGYVNAYAQSRVGNTTVELYLTKNDKKRIKVNGIPIQKMGELMGNIRAIYFSPDELKLVKEAPQDRRRFLDIDLSQLKKSYFYALKRYQKILLQRNNLLKKNSPQELRKTLEIWDLQLAKEGAIIIFERGEFCTKLWGHLTKAHSLLTNSQENINIAYSSQVTFLNMAKEQIEQQLYEKLQQNLEKDLELKYTSVGPHRDDIKILINGIDIKTYGSQGQQRTTALSIKLAELELFREISGEYPVLILDDVLSELDKERQKNLVEICKKTQTLLTTTVIDEQIFNGVEYNVLRVEGGKVFQM